MTPYIGGTQLYAFVHKHHLIVDFSYRIGLFVSRSRGGHSDCKEEDYALGRRLVYGLTKVLRALIMPDENDVSA